VILFAVDCEKGEGPDLAKQYGIPGYPTYVMLTPDGERSAAWLGYDGPESFHEKVTAGIADPRPVTAKAEAYAAAPTVALARVLADDAAAAGRLDDSVTYLRKARELDPAGYPAYTSEIMGNMFFGARKGQFTLDEVDAEASQAQAMAQMGGLHDKVMLLAMRMAGLAAGQGEPARAKPYLERAMTSLQAVPADELPGFAPDLRVAHALIVEGNKPKALELKLAAQPEGWQDDASRLNSVAWWCFENQVNQEQALDWALRGAELAASDEDRAEILDTAAELCQALGNCDEAIATIKRAIELNPGRDYYKRQLAKFEASKAAQAG